MRHSARPGEAEVVRLPRILADYRCGRSHVCCGFPWRATLAEGDAPRIRAALAEAPEVRRRFGRSLSQYAGVRVVKQNAERCVLLERDGDCALQHAGGLGALPTLCRSFPRSVAGTPRGLEVAFLCACPTVAATVVRAPQPFAWVERPALGWPYPAATWQDDDVPWDDEAVYGFAELERLRAAWWEVLAQINDGVALLGAVVGVARAPESPQTVAGDLDELEHALDLGLAGHLHGTLARLPGRGGVYATAEPALMAALSRRWTVSDLARAAGEAPAVWATALGLAVQFAGVHTDFSASVALHGAAWETALGVLLYGALRRATAVAPAEALQDALSVAGQLGCASVGDG